MNPRDLLVVLTIALATAATARADVGDAATAQALFDQGKKLMGAGKFAEACPKLEESQRLDQAIGTVLNLADCYEKAGRVASAWSRFIEAEGMAHSTRHPEAEKVAHDRALKLLGQLSKIVIDVPAPPPGLEVKRDNAAIGSAQWGAAIPADPGPHSVSATAPGRKRWETTIELAPNATTVTVPVPPLEPEPASAIAPPPPASHLEPSPHGPAPDAPAGRDSAAAPLSAAGASRDAPSVDGQSGSGAQKATAFLAGGVGVAGIAVGTIFGVSAKNKRDDATEWCSGAACWDQRGVDLLSGSRKDGTISTVAFVLGGVGLTSSVILFATGGRSPGTSPSARIGMDIAQGRILVRGTW